MATISTHKYTQRCAHKEKKVPRASACPYLPHFWLASRQALVGLSHQGEFKLPSAAPGSSLLELMMPAEGSVPKGSQLLAVTAAPTWLKRSILSLPSPGLFFSCMWGGVEPNSHQEHKLNFQPSCLFPKSGAKEAHLSSKSPFLLTKEFAMSLYSTLPQSQLSAAATL